MDFSERLEILGKQAVDELESNILEFWSEKMYDERNGGYLGSVNFDNQPDFNAAKGGILNARILWTFSSAELFLKNGKYRPFADRAFQYIEEFFVDKEYGGLYWLVSPEGKPLDLRKQVYLVAFGIYSYSEYYKLSADRNALKRAIEFFHLVEDHSRDRLLGGYIEALDWQWKPIGDMRLSDKDLNAPKTMNTHLHILEAYTNLYRVWPDELLGKALEDLVRIFLDKFVAGGNTLKLFFDPEWNSLKNTTSFGHDIEFTWLLTESAHVLGKTSLIRECGETAVRIAGSVAENGMDGDGGIMYEYDHDTGDLHTDKHWWPQSEALVGYLNAWKISGDPIFIEHALKSWEFIRQHVIDHENGEWHNELTRDRKVIPGLEKAGFWKCPYHNSRAMMEVARM